MRSLYDDGIYKANTEMVLVLIWAPDFFGPQEIWSLRNLVPKKFGPQEIWSLRNLVTKSLGPE